MAIGEFSGDRKEWNTVPVFKRGRKDNLGSYCSWKCLSAGLTLSNLSYHTCSEQGIGLPELQRILPTSVLPCGLFYAEATSWKGFVARSVSKLNKDAVMKKEFRTKGDILMCVGHCILGSRTWFLADCSVPSCCPPSNNHVWRHKSEWMRMKIL